MGEIPNESMGRHDYIGGDSVLDASEHFDSSTGAERQDHCRGDRCFWGHPEPCEAWLWHGIPAIFYMEFMEIYNNIHMFLVIKVHL